MLSIIILHRGIINESIKLESDLRYIKEFIQLTTETNTKLLIRKHKIKFYKNKNKFMPYASLKKKTFIKSSKKKSLNLKIKHFKND